MSEKRALLNGRSRVQIGLIGVVVTAMVVIVAMQMDELPYLSPISRYTAYFDDAGGLVTGDIVTVSGVKVGTVENIVLAPTDQGTKASVTFRMNDTVVMGTDTQAAIKTETVLGRRNLTILPHGGGRIGRASRSPTGTPSHRIHSPTLSTSRPIRSHRPTPISSTRPSTPCR